MVDAVSGMSLWALFMVGFLGSGHCVGMCGGITTALGLATEGPRRTELVIGYNLGRVFSYATAGVIVATLGYWGREYLALGPYLRLLAGFILVLMGLYLADWWRVLTHLERLGAHLWRRVQPLGRSLMPVVSLRQALLLGVVWGWLPCGLVYSALALTATAPSPLTGGLMMLAFGAGTAPAMVVGGVFSSQARRFLQTRWLRRVMALAMIAMGVWTVFNTAQHMAHLTHSAAKPEQPNPAVKEQPEHVRSHH